MGRKLLLTALLCLVALMVFAISGEPIPFIDQQADRYFSETTSEAALAYATVRGVNAVVSVLKESQVELSPAGVGLNIAVGQILDPIDDMTERLSTVLVAALVSLGLQKLVMQISQTAPLNCLSVVIVLLILPLWLRPANRLPARTLLIKFGLFMLMLRFLLPLSSSINTIMYQQLLRDQIDEAKSQLSLISAEHKELGSIDDLRSLGFIPSFSQAAKKKIDSAKELYNHISEHGDEIIEALLTLTTLYVSLFILQVIVIPIGMLWLFTLTMNSLFASSTPILQQSLSRENKELELKRSIGD